MVLVRKKPHMRGSTLLNLATLLGAICLFSGQSEASTSVWQPGAPAEVALAGGRPWVEVLTEADGSTGIIHAVIDIAAPRAAVWAVMTDCARTSRLIANATCRVVSGDYRSGSDIREQVTNGNIIFPSMTNVFRSDYDALTRIRFRKAGGDFRTLEGEWRLEALSAGSTRVIYVNRLAINLPIPSALMREGLRRDVPKVLLNLRRESLAAR